MQLPKRKPGQFSTINTDPYLTISQINLYKKELDRLIKVSRPKASNEVQQLSELGDFSENHAYQMAKGRLRGINNRITVLENLLNNAIVIEKNPQNNTIQIGSKIVLEIDGKIKNFQILGSQESDPSHGKISHISPLGAALIGHQVNEIVKIKMPTGEYFYKILKIE